MACTTLLVGKNASYDGSTMIARNDDSGSGHFTAKKFVVVQPEVPGGIGEEHIVYLVLCPTSTPPARAWSGWASCWRPTVLTR